VLSSGVSKAGFILFGAIRLNYDESTYLLVGGREYVGP
jgi:hypothetical protein